MSLTTVESGAEPSPEGVRPAGPDPVRTVVVGSRSYPLVLPAPADARLHIAAVTMALHVLGQTVLGFRVSVPQIAAAILFPALVELGVTFARHRALVWPASAMLTGSGVALILRVVGTEAGDHWTWSGWWYFALISVGSLLTKYLITYRHSHVFNPSNVGLVVAFLVFGSTRIEPLDFWWAPLNPGMIAAYLVIVLGGIAITGRLRLAEMGLVFWLVLAAGMGLLTASGHCVTAAWATQPVCGTTFWWTVITSPEVAIFLFFMITDPRTVPTERPARLTFAVGAALISTLLIAPQATEFGAKVGLLAGLTIMSPLRYPLERWLHRSGFTLDGAGGDNVAPTPATAPVLLARGAILGAALVLLATAVVVAGGPARPSTSAALELPTVDVSDSLPVLPPAEVEHGEELALLLGDVTVDEFLTMLAEDLAIENAATSSGDGRILLGATTGHRLLEREQALDLAVSDGFRFINDYQIDSLTVRPLERDGSQTGAAIAVAVAGTVEVITTDPSGAERNRRTEPLDGDMVLRQGADGRWLIAHHLPSG